MCQLTLLNFHNDFDISKPAIQEELNKLFFALSVINSQEHSDGHGMAFLDGKTGAHVVLKSERSGLVGTVPDICKKEGYVLTSPIMFHVRKVSVRYTKNEILEENAHPFNGEHFVLAHNGTFSGELITANKDDKVIDSQVFHNKLESMWKERDKKDKFVDVLQKTLDLFEGKFALIVRHKKAGKIYVVRGYLTDLHIVDVRYKGKKVGYLINTEDDPLFPINNLCYRFTNFTFDLSEDPKELEKYKVYEVGSENLIEIGEIKDYVKTTVTVYNRGRHVATPRKSTDSSTTKGDLEKTGINPKWLVEEFMGATKLSVPEVNLMFTIMGFPIPYIKNKKEYLKAETKLKELFKDHYRKEKRKILTEIVTSGTTLQEFHQTYAFPYFMLSTKELKTIKEEVING